MAFYSSCVSCHSGKTVVNNPFHHQGLLPQARGWGDVWAFSHSHGPHWAVSSEELTRHIQLWWAMPDPLLGTIYCGVSFSWALTEKMDSFSLHILCSLNSVKSVSPLKPLLVSTWRVVRRKDQLWKLESLNPPVGRSNPPEPKFTGS